MMNILDTDIPKKILEWIQNMQIGPNQYKMSNLSDSTIFTSCFALFILDLFRKTEKFSNIEKNSWIQYIQSFQNKTQGFFEPINYYRKDREKDIYQLTCFCLSALKILNAEPRYPLKFVNQWKTSKDVKEYLYKNGCHLGKAGSGNKAMFLAIFLTYEYERTKEKHFLDKINAWFEFHNETQNTNGFWGKDKASRSLHGVQNGLHQFLIYHYWNKEVAKLDKIVDVVLSCQGRDGFFALVPGGGSCYDYDAIHMLVMALKVCDYRKADIEECLKKSFYAILRNFNKDGGFCHSKIKLKKLKDYFDCIPVCLSGSSPFLWGFRLRSSFVSLIKQKENIYEGWTEIGRNWSESSLWDTWFRSLALAEISNSIKLNDEIVFKNVKFQKMIGLGFFI